MAILSSTRKREGGNLPGGAHRSKVCLRGGGPRPASLSPASAERRTQMAHGQGSKLLKIRSVPLSPCSDPGPEFYSGSCRSCPILTGLRGCPSSLTPDCSCFGLLGLTWWLPSPCWVVRLHQVTLLAKLDGVQLCGLWPGAPHPSEVAEWGEWLGFQEAALCPLQLPALSTERSQTHNHPLKITFAPSWLLEMTLFRIGLQLENCRWPSPTPTVSADSFLLYLS